MAINLNTVNAMIRDENKASLEYSKLSRHPDIPPMFARTLRRIANEELDHAIAWETYKLGLYNKRNGGRQNRG